MEKKKTIPTEQYKCKSDIIVDFRERVFACLE